VHKRREVEQYLVKANLYEQDRGQGCCGTCAVNETRAPCQYLGGSPPVALSSRRSDRTGPSNLPKGFQRFGVEQLFWAGGFSYLG